MKSWSLDAIARKDNENPRISMFSVSLNYWNMKLIGFGTRSSLGRNSVRNDTLIQSPVLHTYIDFVLVQCHLVEVVGKDGAPVRVGLRYRFCLCPAVFQAFSYSATAHGSPARPC